MAQRARNRPAAKGAIGYLPEAPLALRELHPRIGPGKDMLGRLLTDKRMPPAWKALGARIKLDHQWHGLWGEIAYTLRLVKLNRPVLKHRRDAFAKIARAASDLTKSIEEGQLDMPAFELFSDEVMRINGVDGWEVLDSLGRSDRAHRLLREWPAVSECLRELAARAKQSAHDVMRTVPVERTTRDHDAIIVSRRLSAYFKRQYRQPLHATVAAIASVVLSRPVTFSFVENTVRRSKGRK